MVSLIMWLEDLNAVAVKTSYRYFYPVTMYMEAKSQSWDDHILPRSYDCICNSGVVRIGGAFTVQVFPGGA